jgi:hypothetical protein
MLSSYVLTLLLWSFQVPEEHNGHIDRYADTILLTICLWLIVRNKLTMMSVTLHLSWFGLFCACSCSNSLRAPRGGPGGHVHEIRGHVGCVIEPGRRRAHVRGQRLSAGAAATPRESAEHHVLLLMRSLLSCCCYGVVGPVFRPVCIKT